MYVAETVCTVLIREVCLYQDVFYMRFHVVHVVWLLSTEWLVWGSEHLAFGVFSSTYTTPHLVWPV